MADGFIVRRGGVATEQALAPTITQVATTETSITFTITNNDAETAIIRHRLDDITDEGVIVELATNATSANITVTTLAAGTEFTVFATANVTGKVKSNVTQLAISTNEIPAPTITLVSNTDTSVTFTLKNNSVETRDVTFGLTTPPTTTTISLASDATSGNQTFSNLDSDTFITIFAQAEGGLIGQLNVTTDPSLVFTAATGGTTLEYNSGGKRFRSHTFTSNGTFEVTTVGDAAGDRNKVDYLIIAGGGGGGAALNAANSYGGGGGGAGGYRTTNGTSGAGSSARDKVTVTATSFSVTVGTGGAGGSGNSVNGTKGNNSSVAFSSTVTTEGGGFGSRATLSDVLNGGSGGSGGASTAAGTGGSGTANEGTSGASSSNAFGSSGGGGGASAAGSNVTSIVGGAGGAGLGNILRTGSTETRGGGGGGGGYGGDPGGAGGSGGGGAGGTGNTTGSGTSGTANTGGGGGGAGGNNGGNTGSGGNGGDGIIVIRYEIAPSV